MAVVASAEFMAQMAAEKERRLIALFEIALMRAAPDRTIDNYHRAAMDLIAAIRTRKRDDRFALLDLVQDNPAFPPNADGTHAGSEGRSAIGGSSSESRPTLSAS